MEDPRKKAAEACFVRFAGATSDHFEDLWQRGLVSNIRVSRLLEKKGIEAKSFRKKAYLEAAKWIRTVGIPILSAKQAIHYPGIGKSLAVTIEESVSLDSGLEPFVLSEVWGVGPVTAAKWAEIGIESREQALQLPRLTDMQKLGLIHFDDLQKRIPRTEIEEYVRRVSIGLRGVGKAIGTGSFRRETPTSGDIDILIIPGTKLTTEQLRKLLEVKGLILGVGSIGPTKIQGVVRPKETVRRVDFHLTTPDEEGAALLYFTGSKEFNVRTRKMAIELGLKLSERGLFGADGKKVLSSPTEAEILGELGMSYIEPRLRV